MPCDTRDTFVGCFAMRVSWVVGESPVVARRLETTAHEIMTAVHPHPTISEAIKGATEAAYGCAVDL